VAPEETGVGEKMEKREVTVGGKKKKKKGKTQIGRRIPSNVQLNGVVH